MLIPASKKPKPHFSGAAGPSNVALLPAQSIIGRNTTKQKNIDGENSVIPDTLLQMKSQVAGKDTLTTSPGSDASFMPVCRPSHEYETGEESILSYLKLLVGLSDSCLEELRKWE